MRLLEKLPPKWRSLAEEIVKFGLIGGVNTVITFVVFNAFLGIGAIKATVISTVVATTASYFLNRHWTYRHLPKQALRREYILFAFFNGVGMLIDAGFMGVATYGLGFDPKRDVLAYNIFKLGALGIGTIFRFWAYRTFVFGATKSGPNAAVLEDPTPVSPAPAGATMVAPGGPVTPEAAEAVDDAFADILADAQTDTSSSQRLR
ncbi:GtrA family protein [Phytomonospora sp. NPDC050363]|uniref:GtrA family protein n=1 Tax=Phytomonospora sp. NPDC050363 TaxID=3155642 RepID=UPI00340A3324